MKLKYNLIAIALLGFSFSYTVTGMFSEKFPPTIPATSSPVQ